MVVLEQTNSGERSYDIYSQLLKSRVIFLGSAIEAPMANSIVAQILFLQAQSPTEEIRMFINSPGGEVDAGLAIYDTMQFVSAPVSTTAVGAAASMAAVILSAGEPGRRYVLPHAEVMIHQPWGGTYGQVSDVIIYAERLAKVKKMFNEILAAHTGQSLKRIKRDMDRDYYLDAEEAIAYGLVDEIAVSRGLVDNVRTMGGLE